MATKANERMEDARRQGQFEGQVLTTLAEIKQKMESVTNNQTNLDGRVRVNERALSVHDEMFKDSNKVHETLFAQIGTVADGLKTLSDIVSNVVKYQNTQRGIMIAIGTVMPIITSVITVLIVKILTKHV